MYIVWSVDVLITDTADELLLLKREKKIPQRWCTWGFVLEPIISLCASGLDIFIAANTSFFHLHLSGNTPSTSVEVLGLRSLENDTKSNSDIRFMNQRSYQVTAKMVRIKPRK